MEPAPLEDPVWSPHSSDQTCLSENIQSLLYIPQGYKWGPAAVVPSL